MLIRLKVTYRMKLINMETRNMSVNRFQLCLLTFILQLMVYSCNSSNSDHEGVLLYKTFQKGKNVHEEYFVATFNEQLKIHFKHNGNDTIYLLDQSDTIVCNGLVLELLRSDTVYPLVYQSKDTTWVTRKAISDTIRLDDGQELTSLVCFNIIPSNQPDNYNAVLVFDYIEKVLVRQTTMSDSGSVIYKRVLKKISRKK